MLTQRITYNADGTAVLTVKAEAVSMPELIGLADELNLRSTVITDGPIHILNDPNENGPGVPE